MTKQAIQRAEGERVVQALQVAKLATLDYLTAHEQRGLEGPADVRAELEAVLPHLRQAQALLRHHMPLGPQLKPVSRGGFATAFLAICTLFAGACAEPEGASTTDQQDDNRGFTRGISQHYQQDPQGDGKGPSRDMDGATPDAGAESPATGQPDAMGAVPDAWCQELTDKCCSQVKNPGGQAWCRGYFSNTSATCISIYEHLVRNDVCK